MEHIRRVYLKRELKTVAIFTGNHADQPFRQKIILFTQIHFAKTIIYLVTAPHFSKEEKTLRTIDTSLLSRCNIRALAEIHENFCDTQKPAQNQVIWQLYSMLKGLHSPLAIIS